jgi:GTP-binding protein
MRPQRPGARIAAPGGWRARHVLRKIGSVERHATRKTPGERPRRARPGRAGRLPLVAIVGRANVGKSTLFNALLRRRRALVEDRPGVTRDSVVEIVRLEGRDVLLVDTGGLEPDAESGIPAAVRTQVRRAIEDADLIVFVVDAREGLLPTDRLIADELRPVAGRVVVAANKADTPRVEAGAAEFHALGFGELVATSAEHRRGLVDLEVALARRLPPPEPEAAEPTEQGGPRLAIIGRPNVGKSSLLNQLLGESRNIVADEPGTTRDATDAHLEVDGQPVVLTDTAGLRRAGKRRERLERGSAIMALRSLERCDAALLVLDAAEGVTDQDQRLARLALDRGRPLVLVLNKWDRVEAAGRGAQVAREIERRLAFVRDPVIVRTSALTGAGTGRVLPAALALLHAQERTPGTAELNRLLREAVETHAPPLAGRRRVHFYYCTQVSSHPFTLLIFVSDPALVSQSYRRYLESFFRRRCGVASAPLRLRLRRRPRGAESEAG